MDSRTWKRPFAYLLTCFAIFCMIYAASPTALAGKVSISSIQYPAAPETLTVGELVPIVVNIKCENLAESDLSVHFAYVDYPPRFQRGGDVTLSGSGTYQFPPFNIMVPADYSMPSGWPQFINEWHLKAEIWKNDELLLAGKAFTLLVENPEKKPEVEISKIEYVVPPDTIAVNELSQVKINIVYSNLDPGTKAEATLRDSSGLLD